MRVSGFRPSGERFAARPAKTHAAAEERDPSPTEPRRRRGSYAEPPRAVSSAGRAPSVREASRQRQTNRRLRALLVVTVALLALSALAAAFALEKRGQARRDATAAVAQRLGAQALIDPNLDRSLLLAREGMNLDDSEATRSNLLAALLRIPNAIGILHQGSNRILDEALSPDGRTLAVRGDDGNVAFFDTRTLRPSGTALRGNNDIAFWAGIPGSLHALDFSPDGRTLAVGSTTGGGVDQSATVELIGLRTQASRVGKSTSFGFIAAEVAFAPDGRTFATGGSGGHTSPPTEVIVVRRARTGHAIARTRPILGGRVGGYTQDGRFLLVAAGNGRSSLYNARTLRLARAFDVGGVPAVSPASTRPRLVRRTGASSSSTCTPAGRRRSPGGRAAGSTRSASAATAAQSRAQTRTAPSPFGTFAPCALRETFKGHSAAAQAAVFSPDGRTLYTAGYDGSVIVWDSEAHAGSGRRSASTRDPTAPRPDRP